MRLQKTNKNLTYEGIFREESSSSGVLLSSEVSPSYPKDFRSNMEFRHKLLLKASTDYLYQAKLKELFFRDILFAFNCFFYTLDVRKRPFHNQPFITYKFQDLVILELQEAITNGHDLPVEKSRDLGMSWIVILLFLHNWLNPVGGADFLCGSRTEDYVDKRGDMRTLLEKFRYALGKLPSWLLPKGYSSKTHDNFMRIINPETGSAITGESNNPNFSTGGRYAGILLDEFAKWKDTADLAWMAAGDASPCRIPVSSAFGVGGKFFDLVCSGIPKLRLHWTLHPEKAANAYCRWPRSEEELLMSEEELIRSPWYDVEELRRTSEEIAQELSIKYLGSGTMVFGNKAAQRIDRLLRLGGEPVEFFTINFEAEVLETKTVFRDLEGVLVFYEKIHPKYSYTLGVDICEGKGVKGDFSVIKILCRETKSLVASYYSSVDEIRLAVVISLVSNHIEKVSFEAPWVGIETIGPGLSTFDICAEHHDMTNLFMMPKLDSATNNITVMKGWRTTQPSRNRLISRIKEWLLEAEGWVDLRCLSELSSFERTKTGRAEARQGTHDDEVIAFGIALQVDLHAPYESYEVPIEFLTNSLKGLQEKDFQTSEVINFQSRCLEIALEKQVERLALEHDSQSAVGLSV